jgi:hypothetical protein
MAFWLGQGKQVFLEYRIIQVQTNRLSLVDLPTAV